MKMPHTPTPEQLAEEQARVDRIWDRALRGLPPEPKQANEKGNADAAGKELLVIEKGELPKVAETRRDMIAASSKFFDRGGPIRVVKRAGNKLPIASALTTHGVVRAAHQLCRPVKDDGEDATLPDRVASL